MGKIIVPALDTEREMEKLLQSLVDDDESDFSNALDHDVSNIDQRAEVYAVQITAVVISGNKIEVSYDLDYSIYNGCKDMDVQDSVPLHVFGTLTDEGWAFDVHVAPPKRTTLDEY
jgi:hypothetical protein